jgi:class 3 adenylate cyclase
VRERIGDHKGMASSLANIGTLHYQHGAYQEALAHFRKAAELREGIGDRHGQGAALDNMALVLHAMGELDAALAQQAECLAICEEMNDAIGAATTAHNMALIHMERGELQQAREGLFRYRQAMEESGSQQGLASAYINLGTYALRSGDMSQALNWAGKGWDIASGIGALVQMREAAKVLHDVHAARGDWKQALQHHKLHVHLRDSILQEENQREVMRMQLQYGFDKKEALLAAEQEKKDALAREQIGRRELQRNVSFGGFGLLAVVASIILFQRNRIRRERDRSEELLLNILPYETAQELKEKGSSDARLIDQVTVLFTDFKGFTTMSERLSPKDLVRDLHECFSAFDAICQRHGIEKIKTIGDAYMAAGGIPVPNDRHALDVVAAALEMRDFIAEGKARKMAAGLPYFEIRIGIHTGPVVAGIVGIKKFQYDIWGDTVNTASRMESSGEVGRVNLSGSTCALVREQAGSLFDLTPRGKVHAKGKGEVEMWFVERATAAPGA